MGFLKYLWELLIKIFTRPVPEPEPTPIPIPAPDPEPDPIEPPASAPFQTNGYPEFLWPTEYPGAVNQAFGINPQYYAKFGIPAHEGIDMKAPTKSPIRAVWNGTVTRVGVHPAYGNHVRIFHRIKVKGILTEYETIYAHFLQPAQVAVGDKVIRGFQIGIADSTGNSTGSHLHFGMKQFNGNVPNTYYQKKYLEQWAKKDIIDPTPFFKELN